MTRLAVVSHTPHHRTDDGIVGWGPTVTELSHLASRFDEVVHVAPVHDGPAPSSALPYAADNVTVLAVPPAGGEGLGATLGLAAAVPRYPAAIRKGCRGADAVHVRCPANLSGVALAWLRATRDRRPCWVKYAGNWRPDGPEPWSYRAQRRWLRRGFGRVAVTRERGVGRRPASRLGLPEPVADRRGARRRTGRGGGEGPGRPRPEPGLRRPGAHHRRAELADRLGVTATFHGWVDRTGVHDVLARSHVLLLPSRASEGWPKVLSEAMAFGAVPVSSTVSSVPQTFAQTGGGVAGPGDDDAAWVEAVAELVEDTDRLASLQAAGLAAAPGFSFTAYLDAVDDLFRSRWGMELGPR